MRTRWIALVLIAAVGGGCSAKKHLSADQYFNAATEYFRSGALDLAIDQYHELLDQYPFSEYNEEAELRIAHAHYLAGDYPEAIVALTDFQRRHPTSPHLPFVGYYLGMCYVQQMGTIDRDQTAARNAQNYFLTVAQQYPDSPFAALANQELAACREELAKHELYVAHFYQMYGNRKATEVRLLTVASSYGDTKASAKGILQLGELYEAEANPEHAALAYDSLVELHPKSPEAAKARKALARLPKPEVPAGTEPIDVLLAADGRQRSPQRTEIVQVPGLEATRTARRPAAAVPAALLPPADPFGHGRGSPY